MREYQPKTGARCSCKPGVQRDNCPQCEGTGWRIDFKLIREVVREELKNAGLVKERRTLTYKGSDGRLHVMDAPKDEEGF